MSEIENYNGPRLRTKPVTPLEPVQITVPLYFSDKNQSEITSAVSLVKDALKNFPNHTVDIADSQKLGGKEVTKVDLRFNVADGVPTYEFLGNVKTTLTNAGFGENLTASAVKKGI